jgi:hypothetical protein
VGILGFFQAGQWQKVGVKPGGKKLKVMLSAKFRG